MARLACLPLISHANPDVGDIGRKRIDVRGITGGSAANASTHRTPSLSLPLLLFKICRWYVADILPISATTRSRVTFVSPICWYRYVGGHEVYPLTLKRVVLFLHVFIPINFVFSFIVVSHYSKLRIKKFLHLHIYSPAYLIWTTIQFPQIWYNIRPDTR